MKKFFFSLMILCVPNIVFAGLPEPYASTTVLPPDYHGWFSPANQKHLGRIIKELRPTVIVELGSWLGKSTIFMAEQVSKINKNAKVYAIDTWQGSVEHDSMPAAKPRLKTLYQQFLSNCIHKNVAGIIIPKRMTTQEAAKLLKIEPDLIYIDASHEEEDVIADIMNWYEKLRPGGILCGDDWNWQSVARAVEHCAPILGQEIHAEGNFWWLNEKA